MTPLRPLRCAPCALVEERLQHRAEVLAALGTQLVGEPLDRARAAPSNLLRVHVVHAREGVVGHAPAQREGKQLPLPWIQTLESVGELFGLDHGDGDQRTDGIGCRARGVRRRGWDSNPRET